MSNLAIDVWSDIACPWCYVGKRHLEAALATFPQRENVTITWRAFELDPSAPAVQPDTDYVGRLAKKYGRSRTEAQGMIDQMTATAKLDGLDFRFDRVRSGNTFDAHRLLHLAEARGVQDTVKEHFLRGYMTEGVAIGDHAELTSLAVRAGLDADEVASVLQSDTYAAEVRADEDEARKLGISGVPFFVIGRYGVSGAQPAETLRKILDKAWAEVKPALEVFAEGATCGPDGCALVVAARGSVRTGADRLRARSANRASHASPPRPAASARARHRGIRACPHAIAPATGQNASAPRVAIGPTWPPPRMPRI
jgi:predicted DsbA family dithiol-disulfide isomerase